MVTTTRLVLAATLALVGALAPEPSRIPAAPKAVKTSSRRSALLGGVPAAVLLGGAAVANAATSDGDNEFKLADVNKDGKLTRNEFTKWFGENTVLNEPEALPFSLSLPEVALDLTGLAGVVVAIYAGSYAYYLSARMAEAENKAAKQKARAAKDKAAKAKPPAKPAAAAPTLASAEEKPADPPAAA
ncbi:hypothetical protein SO694_00027270 [Aureococcus anophagefferens]|uniref:EF-hand domain-containing protein n=1 Tax=Aureococcus anophagefferens TaxID=44056 RepID=A0ABR1FUS7_AURAN